MIETNSISGRKMLLVDLLFMICFVALLFAFDVAAIAQEKNKSEFERGHELVKQTCYGCHTFKIRHADPEAPRNGQVVNTKPVNDATFRYRLEHPISNTGAITDRADQDAIISWLRSEEVPDRTDQK